MVELDHQPSISLRDLRGFFVNCKEARRYIDKRTEEGSLSPEKATRIKEALLANNKGHFTGEASFPNWLTLSVETEIDIELMEITGFLFRWENQGKLYRLRVSVEARPSNLGLPEPVYYFVCPYSGRICRKLFFDGYSLASRYAFPHTYSKRNYSHRWRDFDRMIRGCLYLDDMGSHRKETYRGKPTPHGKKMERLWRNTQNLDRLHDILIDRERGRPRKDK